MLIMKKIYLSIITFLFILSSNSQDLLVHYRFDANVNDTSENMYDATLYGEPFFVEDRNGNPESALYFDGIDNYVDFPNNEKLKPNLPITISFWAKFDNLEDRSSVTFTTDFEENNHSGVWSSLSSGRIAISYGDNTGNTTSGNRRSKVGNTILSPDIWYHFVFVVRDKLDMNIYINSVNDEGTYSGTSNMGIGYTNNPGSIGRKDSNTNLDTFYFKGTLDEFKYWNKALNKYDVEALYNKDVEVLSASADEYYKNEITIYPNPFKDKITIHSYANVKDVSLFDLRGKEVRVNMNNNDIVNTKRLPNGAYILRVITKEKTFYKKVFK